MLINTIEDRRKVSMKHEYIESWSAVALSEFVLKNYQKPQIAFSDEIVMISFSTNNKNRKWCTIDVMLQYNTYINRGHHFRICNQNLPEAILRDEIVMTSMGVTRLKVKRTELSPSLPLPLPPLSPAFPFISLSP